MLRAARTPVQQTGYCKQDAERGQRGLILTLILSSHKRNISGEKDGEEATRPWWAALARAEAAVPIPYEIKRLELYRRPHSAERQHCQAGSLETSVSQIGHACGFCSLSHAHSPLENKEGKGKKCN